ncbi:MAG: AP endonuclease [Deltaproteobacteria bacterium HGW-Deltaproteobacteria-13]|jgi:sugar phosphate isomerase/epimerase|nr:MAG: AP endonuclease [Deltaproteobacteria bacterium HGW-Deltaproteobacteria-13]
MQDILSKVHAHMPYHLLPEYLEMILQKKLNLEIYFHHWVLQSLDKSRCMETAKILTDAGLKITFHAPFMDLRPGAFDDKIRQASIDRIKQVFDLAPYFHPLKIVCHASFDERYYVFGDDLWLEASLKTWTELIALAKDHKTMIALENIYEKKPDILRRLFEALSSESICFCFDTGHFNVFSYTPLNIWLKELGKYLGHLHLHDNRGQADEHLPVGCGTFPFTDLFEKLKTMKAKPTITLEAHNQDNLWQSMNNIKSMELLYF